MMTKLRGWMVLASLIGVMAYALAEEITLTTYYPSPRGVYQELRTAGNVQIGSADVPELPADDIPRLRVIQDVSVTSTQPALRVDARAFTGGAITPLLIVDKNGNVGIGTTSLSGAKLVVAGSVRIADGTQGAGKMLTSNVTGDATWVSPPTVHRTGTNPTCLAGEVPLALSVNTYTLKTGWTASCNYVNYDCPAAWVPIQVGSPAPASIGCGAGTPSGNPIPKQCYTYCAGVNPWTPCVSYDGANGANGTFSWNAVLCAQ